MSDAEAPTSIGRVLLIAVLVIATLGFGAAGLCGAAFTVMSVPAMFAGGPENFAGAALVIAVPSLLLGLAFVCGRALSRLFRRKP
ncbi:hypothetical protein LXT12_23090 [Pelomonas sp. P7]|uniref:Uncharacterized protein n=1 Tax=Pelomonas caseinilytica TaxID=2906763 RepID=A0ABS8XKP6_9BURK|nr:hypothetical protein [Pelomonas sp. P7]MCE4540142.1 hypothetical protein [Pelomonas sp. P7]